MSLLRAEQSAVESYQDALTRLAGRTSGPRLRQLCVDHSRAVLLLHGLLLRDGELAPSGPGDGPAAFAGDAREHDALVRSLRAGEVRLREAYRQALTDPRLSCATRALIRSDLLRRCEHHVPVLDALSEAAEERVPSPAAAAVGCAWGHP